MKSLFKKIVSLVKNLETKEAPVVKSRKAEVKSTPLKPAVPLSHKQHRVESTKISAKADDVGKASHHEESSVTPPMPEVKVAGKQKISVTQKKVLAVKTNKKSPDESDQRLSQRLICRVTPAEKSAITQHVKNNHSTVSTVLRRYVQHAISPEKSSTKNPLKHALISVQNEQLHQLRCIGNNLNQCTKALHTLNNAQQSDISESQIRQLDIVIGELQTVFSAILSEVSA